MKPCVWITKTLNIHIFTIIGRMARFGFQNDSLHNFDSNFYFYSFDTLHRFKPDWAKPPFVG